MASSPAGKSRRQDPDEPAVKKYFMHGLGHPLGLDVHDSAITTQPLEPGWVMTVEPGIYIPEEGLAVRLENNVQMTATGPVDLMADIPIEAGEIEIPHGAQMIGVDTAARRKTSCHDSREKLDYRPLGGQFSSVGRAMLS